ncbi:MAG: SRPBCC family protein [Hyphomicrobium sp.]
MLKTIALVVLAVIAAFLGYVALQPAVGAVVRSAVIAAPADRIFPHVNTLKKWDDWSPWAKLDPNAKTEFEGPDSGVGAIFKWAGNDEIGQGAMAIVESTPSERLKIRLDFAKPFSSTSDVLFTFVPEGEGTRVTWSMTGERPFLTRAMCILFNADKMVGDMYEKGLANLAKFATAPPPA